MRCIFLDPQFWSFLDIGHMCKCNIFRAVVTWRFNLLLCFPFWINELHNFLKIQGTILQLICLTKILCSCYDILYLIPFCIIKFLEQQKLRSVVLNLVVDDVDHIRIQVCQYFLLLSSFDSLFLFLFLIYFYIQTWNNSFFSWFANLS